MTDESEIAAIIAGFSAKERVIFERMGGPVARALAPAPEWHRPPGINGLATPQPTVPVRRDPATLIQVRLGTGPACCFRDAAAMLDVDEAYLRQKLAGNDCIVRGVRVRRVTPKRRQKKAA